jgi:hypothetical protein
MAYIGQTLLPAEQSAAMQIDRFTFTAFNGQDSFTCTYVPGWVDVYLNGIKQVIGEDVLATTGTEVTFPVARTSDDKIEVISYEPFTVSNTY